MKFKCLECGSPLDTDSERIRCPNCNFSREIDQGVIRFSSADYWGEIPGNELKALAKDAERMHWRDAASIRFKHNYYMYESIAELNRACWKSLLPIGPHSAVLDVGSGLGAITHSLALTFDEVVSVEPIFDRLRFTALRLLQEKLDNVRLIQTDVKHLPFFPKTFDLVVLNGILEWIGHWDDSLAPRDSQLNFLLKIQTLMKPGGYLVVGIENRFGFQFFLGALDHSGLPFTSLLPRKATNLLMRLHTPGFYRATPGKRAEYRTYTYTKPGYQKLLSEAGFSEIEFHCPIPGYNNPSVVIPLKDRRSVSRYLCHEILLSNKRHGTSLTRILKRLAILSGIWFRFFPDFLIFGKRPASASSPDSVNLTEGRQRPDSDSIIGRVSALVRDTLPVDIAEGFSFSLYTQPFSDKHVLRISSSHGENLAMMKVINGPIRCRTFCVRGHENLEFIHRTWGDNPFIRQSIPRPLARFEVRNMSITVETHLKGAPFSSLTLKRGYFAHQGVVRKHMTLLVDWISRFFEITGSRNFGEPDFSCFQHGDFFVDNILFDSETNSIGVVDWDGFGDTYPPLFDFFCLLSEFYFTLSAPRKMSRWEIEMLSFKDTFFRKNWFSELVKESCLVLCNRMHLKASCLSRYFSDYLSVRREVYGGMGGAPMKKEWHELYGKYVDFYEENKNEFVLGCD